MSVVAGLLIVARSWAFGETTMGYSPEPGISTGRSLYDQHWLRCHGVALDGKGPIAVSLGSSDQFPHVPVSDERRR
jgi:hypothetical protein